MHFKFVRWAAGVTVALSLFATAGAVQASALSQTQISSIIGLLQSFGADQSIINRVSLALGGPVITDSLTCSSFADVTYGNFDDTPGGRVSQLQTWLGIPSSAFGFGTYGHKTQIAWNARCSTQPMPPPGVSSATIDQSSLTVNTDKDTALVTLTGSATGMSTIFLSVPDAKVYMGVSIPVINGRWSANIGAMNAGSHQVMVYDSNNNLLSSGTLTVNANGSAYALPVCTLTATPTTNGSVVLSWFTRSATYTTWQQDGTANRLGLGVDKMATNGSQTVTAGNTKDIEVPTLLVYGPGGSSSCSTRVSIVSSNSATIDYTSGWANASGAPLVHVLPDSSFRLTGTVSPSNVSTNSLTVFLVGSKPTATTVAFAYTGTTDIGTINSLTKDGSGYVAVSNTANVQALANGGASSYWSASFGAMAEGWYRILIYDASGSLIGTGLLYSTYKG